MNLFAAAFFFGFAGSLHCLGMCGPLLLTIRRNQKNQLVYHFARILMYGLLGAIAGSLGYGFAAGGWMRWATIVSGLLLLLSVFPVPKLGNWFSMVNPVEWLFRKLRLALSPVLKNQSPFASFALGLVNGMLPCGLLYAGLAGAMASSSISYGMLCMSGFGLGTLPFAILLSFGGRILQTWDNTRYVLQITTGLQVVVALLLILRGLDLGIPWLSPKWNNPLLHASAGGCH